MLLSVDPYLYTPTLLTRFLINTHAHTNSGEQFPMLEKYQVEVVEARDFPAKGSDVLPLLKHFIPTPDTPVYLTIDLGISISLPHHNHLYS